MSRSTPRLILASQSPYRQALLASFGLKFEVHAPNVDEEQLKKSGPRELEELTRYLALAKAQSLAEKFPDALILGSDQIAEFEGDRLDKPGNRENTIRQLRRLKGKTHRLLTSLALCHHGQTLARTDVTSVKMRAYDDETLEAYVDLDRPWDCAGGYKIERAGLALIEAVETHDPSAIQGLPLTALVQMIGEMKFSLSDFWSHRFMESP